LGTSGLRQKLAVRFERAREKSRNAEKKEEKAEEEEEEQESAGGANRV